MNIEEYQRMYELEETHWWYKGLRKISSMLIEKHCNPAKKGYILDAGCGTGANLQMLRRHGPVWGIDNSPEAIRLSRKRRENSLLQASILALPFKAESFAMVASFDVISHVRKGLDLTALQGLYRVCQPGGKLILNLPAYNSLRSEHDEAIHSKHRYTKRELVSKVRDCGFIIERASYWNTFLFPLAATLRLKKKFRRRSGPAKSDVKAVASPLNFILTRILYLEALFLKRINLPFGLSIIVIARKDKIQ